MLKDLTILANLVNAGDKFNLHVAPNIWVLDKVFRYGGIAEYTVVAFSEAPGKPAPKFCVNKRFAHHTRT